MTNSHVDLVLEELAGQRPLRFEVKTLAMGMWCARNPDPAAIIDSQKQLGWQMIADHFPQFCKASTYLLTTGNEIEVQGNQTCGEVEVVALADKDDVLIGIGSDHCDRAVEQYFYYKAKQMCRRVLAPRVWRYADVENHWDQLRISAAMSVGGRTTLFQGSEAGVLRPPRELLLLSGLPRDGLVLYCGTPPMPDYIYGDAFSIELHDPVLNRSLRHSYAVKVLNPLA